MDAYNAILASESEYPAMGSSADELERLELQWKKVFVGKE